jgi:hypothetical protein
VEFFNLIFRLGVVLAIFSFIWGFIKIGLTILRGGMPLSAPMNIGIKTLQYLSCYNRFDIIDVLHRENAKSTLKIHDGTIPRARTDSANCTKYES